MTKKTITLTESELRKAINDIVLEATMSDKDIDTIIDETLSSFYVEETLPLIEGIDVVYRQNKYRIKYNPNRQNLVDTSVENSPILNTDIIQGIEVYSLFQRKKDETGFLSDGNPLVYALKGSNKYVFDTQKDYDNIVRQIKSVMQKYALTHKANKTVFIPSLSKLNSLLCDIYKEVFPDAVILKEFILKMSVDEVIAEVEDPTSDFMNYYYEKGSKKGVKQAMRYFRQYCEKMRKEDDGIFSIHKIKDIEMRKHIKHTLKKGDNPKGVNYDGNLNDCDVLIIDDTITNGTSIQQAVDIMQTYQPESVSVLTLFSPLQTNK